MPKPRIGAPRKDYQWAVDAYERGMGCPEIATIAGITPQAMREALVRRGVKFRTPGWRGGVLVAKGYTDPLGYVRVHTVGGKKVLKHRAIAGITDPAIHVHHKDGNPSNNDPSNLQILSNSEHHRLHWAQRRREVPLAHTP